MAAGAAAAAAAVIAVALVVGACTARAVGVERVLYGDAVLEQGKASVNVTFADNYRITSLAKAFVRITTRFSGQNARGAHIAPVLHFTGLELRRYDRELDGGNDGDGQYRVHVHYTVVVLDRNSDGFVYHGRITNPRASDGWVLKYDLSDAAQQLGVTFDPEHTFVLTYLATDGTWYDHNDLVLTRVTATNSIEFSTEQLNDVEIIFFQAVYMADIRVVHGGVPLRVDGVQPLTGARNELLVGGNGVDTSRAWLIVSVSIRRGTGRSAETNVDAALSGSGTDTVVVLKRGPELEDDQSPFWAVYQIVEFGDGTSVEQTEAILSENIADINVELSGGVDPNFAIATPNKMYLGGRVEEGNAAGHPSAAVTLKFSENGHSVDVERDRTSRRTILTFSVIRFGIANPNAAMTAAVAVVAVIAALLLLAAIALVGILFWRERNWKAAVARARAGAPLHDTTTTSLAASSVIGKSSSLPSVKQRKDDEEDGVTKKKDEKAAAAAPVIVYGKVELEDDEELDKAGGDGGGDNPRASQYGLVKVQDRVQYEAAISPDDDNDGGGGSARPLSSYGTVDFGTAALSVTSTQLYETTDVALK